MCSQITPADLAREDTFSPDSYWWLFHRLNTLVKGDVLKSLPGYYRKRNPEVRGRFDILEQTFSEQIPNVVNQANQLKEKDPAGMAEILDDFSDKCINQVLDVLQDMLGRFTSQ